MHIEFSCQICGARCKTYNRYAIYVDGAEALGRATCELFGVYCQARDMTMPAGLDYQRLNTTHILPKILGFSPTTSLVDEGMVTARGPAEEENMPKPIKKPVRRQRHVRDTRFMPVI